MIIRVKSMARRGVHIVVSLLFVLLIAGIVIKSFVLKPAPDDTIGVKDWLVVPVFYATTRKFIGHDNVIAYSEDPASDDPQFGVKNMVVPAPTERDISPQEAVGMEWQAVHRPEDEAGKVPNVDLASTKIKDATFSKEEAVIRFRDYTTRTGRNQSVIFVHGCCANFETSLKRAGKIAAHLGTPVFIYDWVSPSGFSRYLQNETRVHQTVDDFCRFISHVDQVADPSKISLLGHSMGAMFVDEAMVRRAVASQFEKIKPFKEIIMSNSDVDAQAYLEHANEFSKNADVTTIYVSRSDDRLDASAIAHGGFNRLGAPGALVDKIALLEKTRCIDITENNSGHEIPFKIVAALHDKDIGSFSVKDFSLQKTKEGYYHLKRVELKAAREPQPLACKCN